MRRVRVALAVLTICGAAILPAEAQEYEKPFKAGLEAREKNWKEAERQMREAIRLNPRESQDKVRTGFGSIARIGGTEYVPYFFLGEALFRQDDCAGAMDAWYRSELQNVVQKTERYKPLLAGLDACERKGLLRSPKFEEAVTTAIRELTVATNAAETARGHGATADDAFTAERQNQLEAAAALIRDAYARLDSGRRTRAAAEFVQITAATRQAGTMIAALEKELAAAILARQTRLAAIDRDVAAATDADRAIEQRKAVLTDGLTAARQAGRDSLARARRAAEALRAGTAGASLAEGETLAASAKDKLQQVLNDAIEIERREKVARTEKDLRAVRQRLLAIDQGFKDFDAAIRPATDPKLTARRKALEKRYRSAVASLDTAGKNGDAAAIQVAGKTADQIRTQLAELLQELGVKPAVPEALLRAVTLFLDGQPAAALEALDGDAGLTSGEPLLAHVYLFRAAARYALYLKSKSSDAAQLVEARDAITQMADLNPALEPDPRAFAPRFIDFVRTVRREAVTTPADSSRP